MKYQPDITAEPGKTGSSSIFVRIVIATIMAVASIVWVQHALSTAEFVVTGLIDVAPIVIPGILVAAWIIASGADGSIAAVFDGRLSYSTIAASLIGAITVLPMMAGFHAAGVPLTPSLIEHGMSPGAAMAFLVSGCAVSIWGQWR